MLLLQEYFVKARILSVCWGTGSHTSADLAVLVEFQCPHLKVTASVAEMLLTVFWVLAVKSETDCLKSLSGALCDKSFSPRRTMSDHLVSCAISGREELTPVRHR